LLWALVERMTITWSEQRLRPLVSDVVGVDALTIILDAIRASIRRSPREMQALYSLMFEALKPVPILRDRMSLLHRGLRREVEGHLRRGIEAGVVRAEVDPAASARLFVGVLRGSAYQWLLEPDAFDIDAALEELGDHLGAFRLKKAKSATTRRPAPGGKLARRRK
jgi:hypothetical protein